MLLVSSALPFQPESPRFFSVQILLDLESSIASELLRVPPDQQDMIGLLHDFFRDQRRGSDPFEAGDRSSPFERSVHDRGIELDHALRIGQATISDTRV